MTLVDGNHRLQALLQLAAELKVDWASELVWVRYIRREDGRIVSPAEAMIMRSIWNETKAILKWESELSTNRKVS